MDRATRLLVNLTSMEVSNLLDFLKSGVGDCRILSTFYFMLRPQGGSLVPMGIMVPVLSLESGLENLLIPVWIGVEIGMDPSTPVLIIHHRVLLVHSLPGIDLAKISSTLGVSSVCDVSLIVDFVSRSKTETSPMIRQHIFLSMIQLVVWVTLSGLLVRFPCASLTVTVFN